MNNNKFQLNLLAVAVIAATLPGCELFDNDDDKKTLVCESPLIVNEDKSACVDSRKLHVASPDWRDQVIYFAMTDRFNDGDSSNNDQGAGEFDTTKESHYSGGDITGITDKIDYIKELGATALWITPIVANQWWDPINNYGGYHGYWARDFKAVDEHYGTLEDYKDLSHALHENDMYLVQDVVVNHMGNFFHYDGAYNPENTAENFKLVANNQPTQAPVQAPFNMNDRNNPDHVSADIYHWTPIINDYKSTDQEKNYQMSGLDDLNTSNPVVRDALRDSFAYWITETGVDAFRLDTAKFVKADFWNDFLYSESESAPGIKTAASKTGRNDFLTFGEVWESSSPMMTEGEDKINEYSGTAEQPGIDTLINFPLRATINRVFAGGQPTSYMSFRLKQHMATKDKAYTTPIFIENHDTQRFLAKGTKEGLKQALTMLMTIPGIPVIYQGTEQELLASRESMFVGGYKNDTADHFDTETEMFKFTQKLTKLRTENRVFTRGTLEVLADNPVTSGAFAYKREYEGKTALVLMNTSGETALLNKVASGLENGTTLQVMHANNIDLGDSITVGNNGAITLEIPANAVVILLTDGNTGEQQGVPIAINVNEDIAGETFAESLTITGTTDIADVDLKLVIDGDLSNAMEFKSDANGDWNTVLPVSNFIPGLATHTVAIYDPELKSSTETMIFKSNVELEGVEVSIEDPKDDATGFNGNYIKPADASFSNQMDIEKVDLKAAGSVLTLTMTMQEFTDTWNPDNGFDHVSFSVFFDLPGGNGQTTLPLLHGDAPENFKWDIGHVAFGWGNAMFNNEGADADTQGENLGVAPVIEVNKEARTVTFTYNGSAFGVNDWEEAKIYISTWDIDGMSGDYRKISSEGGEWEFAGGSATDPLIMDDTVVIEVPVSGLTIEDPADDEAYNAPQNESYSKQMDILSANVKTAGSNLQLKMKMAEITDSWNPDNGFDHVSFTVFIDQPDLNGATVLPFLNADAPEDFNWEVMASTFGWGNGAYSSEDVAADKFGKSITPSPIVTVNKEAGTITLLFTAKTLGNPLTLEGSKLYITTWDIDGMSGYYRTISQDGAEWEFGGDTTGPNVMDSIMVTLP